MLLRINLHPQKFTIAMRVAKLRQQREKAYAVYRVGGGKRVVQRDHHTVEPEWNEIEAPIPMGWWRRVEDAPAGRAVEPYMDALNPDLWTEEREYELMRGITADGRQSSGFPWTAYTATVDEVGVTLGEGSHRSRRYELIETRARLLAQGVRRQRVEGYE